MQRLLSSVLGIICGLLTATAQAAPLMLRDFWYPLYHAERLDYCLTPQKDCGRRVADKYCRLMGYAKSQTEQIEHHVGLTHYLGEKSQCQGWQCDGFKLITCVGVINSPLKASYLRRTRHFAVPRMDNYRVAWCYQQGRECGKRAAYGFCRRMGYSHVSQYKKQSKLPATRTLGDKTLCFGRQDCQGFASISCSR